MNLEENNDFHRESRCDAEVTVEFSISGNLDPSIITSYLQISPDHATASKTGKPGVRSRRSLGWIITEGPLQRSDFPNINSLFQKLAYRLTGKELAIRHFSESNNLDIFFTIKIRASESNNDVDFGFLIDLETISLIQRFHASLLFVACESTLR
jgi:hypothetical protein